jgi:hypothetical protein
VRTGGATKGRGAGYPLAVRGRVIAYVEQCRERGEGMKCVAGRLGLSVTTVTKWVHGPKPAFATVEVVDDARIVLVSPAGWRTQIDVATLAVLVGSR